MATAGYTTIGGSEIGLGSSNARNPSGLLVTFPVAGSVTKITAYVKNSVGSSNQTAALYAGSAGARGALIATTNTSSVTTSYAWVDFTFATPQEVTATTYWIQFNPDGDNGPGGNTSLQRYDAGGAADTSYIISDLGVPTYGTDQFSMYATYTPTEVGGFTIALV